jgi:hypothetical protein
MTSATRTVTASTGQRSRRGPARTLIGIFRDPRQTFVVLAVLVGGYLVFAVPYFGGIDEPAHFYRSYQISTGQLVPEKIAGSQFSGACVSRDLVREVSGYQRAYFEHLVALAPGGFTKLPQAPGRQAPRCSSADERPVTFSTFGSPVPYAPQAATVFVARELGAGAGAMLVAGRIVLLGVYVALIAVAVCRTRRARWAFVATALIPVAVFQSASSLSPDAMTTAVALLVVSSALRALDPPDGATVKGLVIEAAVLSTLLGMCKPAYVVVAGCYLLPLLGPRERQARLWALAPAAGLGVIVTLVWNEIVGDLWRSDAVFFGIRPDPDGRKHDLFTAPWHFVADAARTIPDQFWDWLKGLWGVGPSVTHWPALLIVSAVVLFVLVSIQHDRREPAALDWSQRGLLIVLFVIGMTLVFAAIWIYWTTPGDDVISGLQARYFVPLLVLLPVAAGTPAVRWLGARDARLPLAVLLAPFFVVCVVSVTFRMH